MGKISNRVINGVAEVMSAGSKVKHGWRAAGYDRDRKTLKTAASYKGMPDYDDNGPTDAYKARFMAKEVKSRRMPK